jgi:hypothetical protein
MDKNGSVSMLHVMSLIMLSGAVVGFTSSTPYAAFSTSHSCCCGWWVASMQPVLRDWQPGTSAPAVTLQHACKLPHWRRHVAVHHTNGVLGSM